MQSSLHYSGINISYMHFVSDLFHTLRRDFGLLLCTAKQHSIPLSGDETKSSWSTTGNRHVSVSESPCNKAEMQTAADGTDVNTHPPALCFCRWTLGVMRNICSRNRADVHLLKASFRDTAWCARQLLVVLHGHE